MGLRGLGVCMCLALLVDGDWWWSLDGWGGGGYERQNDNEWRVGFLHLLVVRA